MGKRAIEISGELWQEWLTRGFSIGFPDKIECTEGLPEGATFHAAFYRQWPGMSVSITPSLVFVFEHPDWPAQELGKVIPSIDVVFRKFYAEDA